MPIKLKTARRSGPYKVWRSSPSACGQCSDLDGTILQLDEAFETDDGEVDGPPAHPNCECDVDEVETLADAEARILMRQAEMASLRQIHVLGSVSNAVRTETLEGRDHLVIPLVALVEGVIHAINATEPEYVPPSAFSTTPQLWNGRPVVLGHPAKDGEQISANDPRVLEQYRIGQVFNARVEGRKLLMEAWIDPVRVLALGGQALLDRMKSTMEVSVGAFVGAEKAAGVFNGKKYNATWRSIGPDHLAFLPHSTGACSIEMGCGTHRAAHAFITAAGAFETLRDIPQSERDTLAEGDFAGPNQSFPIVKQADVDAAAHLVGHAADPEAVKRKIIAIAKRKGLTIPEAWRSAGGPGSGNFGHQGYGHANIQAYRDTQTAKRASKVAFDSGKSSDHQVAAAARTKAAESHRKAAELTQDSTNRTEHLASATFQDRLAAHHASNPGTTRMLEDKVTTSLKDRLKSFFMATLDAMPEPGADETDPEEQAEAIQYKAIQTLLDQALTSLQTGRESVDALAASDLDDEVEDAHLEALVAMCIQMYGTINGVIKIATSCLQPDSPVGGSVMAYSEHRAAAGARHSAGDRKIIQDAHDNLVTLGADCTSMKAADGNKPCGCKGEDMTTEQRTATIAELTAVTHEGKGFSAEEAKGISMLSDSTLSALKTAAAKSPADMIIQAKAAADAALAGHAHGLNTADAAAQAKKDAKAKADAEEAKMAAAAANTTTTKPRALADFLADPTTPVEVRSLVERQIAAEAEAKAKLVNVLKVAQKEYTEAELTAMSTPELERLTRLTKIEAPVDFSGRGAALPLVGAGAAGATETFTAPDPWAEGLKARSATK